MSHKSVFLLRSVIERLEYNYFFYCIINQKRVLMIEYFGDFVEENEAHEPLLPLAHTFRAAHLETLIKEKTLFTRECDTFLKENLLYFYYGKPAYRLDRDEETIDNTDLEYLYPVTILLNSKGLKHAPAKVFASDSGALEAGIFNKDVGLAVKPQTFQLVNKVKSAAKVVKTFYGDNHNYYYGKPFHKDEVEYDISDSNISKYIQLISNNISQGDNRKRTVEVIFNEDIDLTKCDIDLVIFPVKFEESEKLMNLLKNVLKVNYKSYDTDLNKPNEAVPLISKIVGDHYKSKNLFKGVK